MSDCEQCPELENEAREREAVIEILEEQIATLRAWLTGAPHKQGCSMTYGLGTCTCGRDKLKEGAPPPARNDGEPG